jgi:DNA-binding NarL/FixJ family response regulator
MAEHKKILIVEDQMISAKGIERTLQRHGFVVTGIAASGKAAMQLIDQDKPDLVIVDIKLKGKEDGISIADQVQSQFDLPTVILTANTDDETIERVYHLGAYGYLIKPYKDEKLVEVVEFALANHARKRDVW